MDAIMIRNENKKQEKTNMNIKANAKQITLKTMIEFK